jgi:hypothetical protein
MTAQSTQQASGMIVGFVDDLNDAIKENPVAAGVVGMGVLWMLFGTAKISGLGRALPSAAGVVSSAVGIAAEATGDAVSLTASRVSNVARQAGETISTRLGEAATAVRDGASAGSDAIKDKSEAMTGSISNAGNPAPSSQSHIGSSIKQNLSETLEGQPMLLGVIGAALGAGIASMFPATKMEQELMGETGTAAKHKLQEIATAAVDRAKDVVDEVKKEAAVQGLTSEAAKDDLQSIAQKVKTAAATSQQNLKERLTNSDAV